VFLRVRLSCCRGDDSPFIDALGANADSHDESENASRLPKCESTYRAAATARHIDKGRKRRAAKTGLNRQQCHRAESGPPPNWHDNRENR
jgi:hypothetical protein